jgi:hypothetical protein
LHLKAQNKFPFTLNIALSFVEGGCNKMMTLLHELKKQKENSINLNFLICLLQPPNTKLNAMLRVKGNLFCAFKQGLESVSESVSESNECFLKKIENRYRNRFLGNLRIGIGIGIAFWEV